VIFCGQFFPKYGLTSFDWRFDGLTRLVVNLPR